MTAFFTVMDKLITLFLLMVIGYVARKKNVFDENFTNGMVKFLMSICMPAMVINTLQVSFTPELLKKGGTIFFISLIVYAASLLIGIVSGKLFKIKYNVMGIWIFSVMFPNHAFMGWPVMSAVLGQESMFYATFANLAFSAFVYTVGVIVIAKYGNEVKAKISLKKIFLTPVNIGIAFGLALFIFNIKLPSSVGSMVSSVASVTTPIAMIYIGAVLTRNRVRDMFNDWRVYAISAVRLVVVPLLAYVALRPFVKDYMIFAVLILGHAMPVASFCAIFAGEYGGDVVLSSKFIFVSTLLCILTIPFISLLVV